MVRPFDHVTVAVTNVDEPKAFFGSAGFEDAGSPAISGPAFTRHIGGNGPQAEDVSLVVGSPEESAEELSA